MATTQDMGDIDCIYNEINACVHSFYEAMNKGTKEGRDRAYGLVMAIERLNDEIGRRAGVIE